MRFSAAELVAALTARNLHGDRARLVGPDVEIDGVTFDSRDVRPGQLFVPIVAERDGHDFIGDALAAGAVAYLSSRDDAHARFGGTAIRVRDTAESLIDVGGWVRTLFPASTVVVGVTGSVGKTSTKDFIAVALGGQIATTANIRSFNNEQGLPVTIINAPSDTRALVLEMGMRGFGQIADLCRIARPSIGVVTRVGEAHTELVGGLDGVAQAKGELIEALPPQGFAILNADDERVRAMASRSSAPVLLYGESGDADVRIDGLAVNEHGCATFDVIVGGERTSVTLGVPGRHMASNAAAAIAVGHALGLSVPRMASDLAATVVSDRRMQIRRTSNGAVVIDDSYNANPTSMEAALRTLADINAEHRVAVLGLMAELDDPSEAHARIGALARSLGIRMIAVDTDMYGVPSSTAQKAIDELAGLTSHDVAVVKGSRVAGLERVVDAVAI
ncbi:MAG: UDP-N-acetylmuramoyl-tripeptide--D-alanyl-D-alanine ligase [Ilumatobacteraceae bacterium]